MNDNNEREKQLDGLLDTALARYGAAEPLHGIEDRVLGRLRGERDRRAWWLWGGAAAAALAAVVVVVLMMRPAENRPAVVTAGKQPEVVARHEAAPQPVAPKQSAPAETPKREPKAVAANATKPRESGVRNQGVPPVMAQVAMGSLPRRDVFPTPTPPTTQEILLARYVQVTPRDEVLAQATRKPLEFHEDPLSVPVDGGGGTSPQKAQGMK